VYIHGTSFHIGSPCACFAGRVVAVASTARWNGLLKNDSLKHQAEHRIRPPPPNDNPPLLTPRQPHQQQSRDTYYILQPKTWREINFDALLVFLITINYSSRNGVHHMILILCVYYLLCRYAVYRFQ